ncbi:hypothetical protein EI94DRAFT_1749424 [Lactarius quietus]|nr:hypothetical protein EI94DRAFT_1749424 [Lactarius quietus]
MLVVRVLSQHLSLLLFESQIISCWLGQVMKHPLLVWGGCPLGSREGGTLGMYEDVSSGRGSVGVREGYFL